MEFACFDSKLIQIVLRTSSIMITLADITDVALRTLPIDHHGHIFMDFSSQIFACHLMNNSLYRPSLSTDS